MKKLRPPGSCLLVLMLFAISVLLVVLSGGGFLFIGLMYFFGFWGLLSLTWWIGKITDSKDSPGR
jgi:hypothetical protein